MLPILVALTLGVVDGARIFAAQISLANGVREAAIFGGSPTGAKAWCPAALPNPYIVCPGSSLTGQSGQTMADRIVGEAHGLTLPGITLATPVCTNSAGVAVTCTDVTATTVKVSATYRMSLHLTALPVIGAIWPNPVVMTSSTTAAILR